MIPRSSNNDRLAENIKTLSIPPLTSTVRILHTYIYSTYIHTSLYIILFFCLGDSDVGHSTISGIEPGFQSRPVLGHGIQAATIHDNDNNNMLMLTMASHGSSG